MWPKKKKKKSKAAANGKAEKPYLKPHALKQTRSGQASSTL